MTWGWNVDEEYQVGYIAKINSCGELKLGNGWQRSVGGILLIFGKDIRFILEWHPRYILSEGKHIMIIL